MTKCNENQSKEETKNKAPKIINTGKYMINQPVNITYQEAQGRVLIGKYTKNKPVNREVRHFSILFTQWHIL